MKKLIWIAAAAVLLAAGTVALVGASSSRSAGIPGSEVAAPAYLDQLVAGVSARLTTGKAELQRTIEAKKAVKSFRMTTLLRLHPGHPLETVVDVSCPDRERFTTTIGDRTFHAVRIGGKAYVEQQNGDWTVQDTPPSGWSPCGENPGEPAPWAVMNEGRDPAAVLGKVLESAEIVRGSFIATGSGNCQQWVVSLKLPQGAAQGHGNNGLRYTVCIDPKQHLPVAVSMGSGGMVTRYSDWNKPIQIEAPLK
jgi:hypothetical protein